MYQVISNYIKTTNKAVLITALTIFCAACSKKQEQIINQSENTKPIISYPTAKIQSINPTFQLSIPGQILPYEQVNIYAKVSGFVKQILVESGDYVKKGQLLAVLQAPEMQQMYLSDKSKQEKAYSDYLYAKQSYQRLVEASKTSGAVAGIELERSKASLDSSLAAYNAAKASALHAGELQEYLMIKAPFDGVITQRGVSVGALTNASGESFLFTIAQNNKLRLVVYLPEKYAASVKKGAIASFTVAALPGKVFKAEVSRSSTILDHKDRSLRLELDIDNSTKELTGGDYAQVKIDLKRAHPSYWTNSKSILHTQSGNFVYTLNGNTINRVAVELGVRLDTLTEVFGDLNPQDNIIVKPSEQIKIGLIEQ
ncbi:efflux RND transporter periplasmic adaptor subunit [Myroides sp. LJL119]